MGGGWSLDVKTDYVHAWGAHDGERTKTGDLVVPRKANIHSVYGSSESARLGCVSFFFFPRSFGVLLMTSMVCMYVNKTILGHSVGVWSKQSIESPE